MTRDCDRCRYGLKQNAWLSGLPDEPDFVDELPCSSCSDAGSKFEQAKGAPFYENTRGHPLNVAFSPGADEPGARTWRMDPDWTRDHEAQLLHPYFEVRDYIESDSMTPLIAFLARADEQEMKRFEKVLAWFKAMNRTTRGVLCLVLVEGVHSAEAARRLDCTRQNVSKTLKRLLRDWPGLKPLAARSEVKTAWEDRGASRVVPLG